MIHISQKIFVRIIAGVIAFVALIIVFQAGVLVGYRKAQFAEAMDKNYYTSFGPQKLPPQKGLLRKGATAHGATGKVLRVNDDIIVLADPDGDEKEIIVNASTTIRLLREEVALSAIHEDAFLVVIGTPTTDARITAKLIRILPPPAR